jgi:PAS domain S-box-containing protein
MQALRTAIHLVLTAAYAASGAAYRWLTARIRALEPVPPDADPAEAPDLKGVLQQLTESDARYRSVAAESERQRRLYETVLSNTPDFIYVFSLDYRVLYANDALIRMWGRGVEGAIGKTFVEIGYEQWHADMHAREIDQVRATRQPIRGEVPFTGSHGGRRQYEYIFVPVMGEDGTVEAVAGTTRDITTRLETEAMLRAREVEQAFVVRLADTIRPLSDPIAVQSVASRLLGEQIRASRVAYFERVGDDFTSARAYHDGVAPMVGRFSVASFGRNLLAQFEAGRTAVSPDVHDDDTLSPAERSAFDAIQASAYVGVPLVKDGIFVAGLAVHSAVPRDWTPTEIAIIEATAERTWAAVERARAETALRMSEERYRTLFGTMDEGFCVLNVEFDESGRAVDYRVEEMNPAFEKQTGMQGLTGVSIRRAIPALEEFWFEMYGRVASTGKAVRFVHQAEPMSGRYFDVSAFRLGDDDSTRVAVLFTDISPRVHAEAEREGLVRQLREQDRRKDEFLATLAHELRNPLAPISNGLELLRLTHPGGAIESTRAMMERQLAHLVRLVDDLLDISRVTSGKLELRREPVALQAVITAEEATSRTVMERAGLELTIVMPDEPAIVHGDPVRLAQIVSNLLNNAAKYTPLGGRILLTVERQDEIVQLSIADTGVGIPPAMLEPVFDLFTQVDRALEKTTGGLGIGLSLARGLVEMHGGTIEARSEGEGRGSEFVVRLPVAAHDAASASGGDGAAEGETSDHVEPPGLTARRRILVIDDNDDAADSLGELLSRLGHDVRTAYDGEAGVQVAMSFQPELVLCDIAMPKASGYSTARQIRAQPWGRRALLVALTGWGQQADRQRSVEAGFDHHLVKPVEVASLMTLLSSEHAAYRR